jgi:murein DD-endopeptidase MepM/ murein hydrolase activator NlpD
MNHTEITCKMKRSKDKYIWIIPFIALFLVSCAYQMETPKFIKEIAAVRNEKIEKLEKANERVLVALRQHRILKAHSQAYIWPIAHGRLSSKFGKRWGRRHDGIDIAAPKGTSIRAARAGKVIYSGNGVGGYGNMVVLNHGGGFRTVYAHNKKNLVRRGDYVKQSEVIALVGSSGRSSGPHLHFEVRQGSKPYNPLHFFDYKAGKTSVAKR